MSNREILAAWLSNDRICLDLDEMDALRELVEEGDHRLDERWAFNMEDRGSHVTVSVRVGTPGSRALAGRFTLRAGEAEDFRGALGGALVTVESSFLGPAPEIHLFEIALELGGALEDRALAASFLCRAAARLWMMGGGNAESFAKMAKTQADAEKA